MSTAQDIPTDRIPAEVRLAAGEEVAFATSEDGPRRFEGVLYSGGVVNLGFVRAIFDLGGITGRQKQPALLNHDPGKIVGYTDRVDMAAGRPITVAGVLSGKTEAARHVADLADEQFPWQMSARLAFAEWLDDVVELRAGESRTVNGRKVEGPDMLVIPRARLREATFCALGKDDDTSAFVLSEGGATFDRAALHRSTTTSEDQTTMSDQTTATAPTGQPTRKPATVAELKAAFPGDPGYVLEQLEAEATLAEAKALKARLDAAVAAERAKAEALEAELATLREQQAAFTAAKPEGVAPLSVPAPGSQRQTGGTGDAVAEYEAKVREVQLAEGVRRSEATKRVGRRDPDLHRRMLEQVNGCQLSVRMYRSDGGAFQKLAVTT